MPKIRAFLLLAGVALSLAACRNNDQADNTANVDENLSAENIVSNDVTAIDAVTGEAANMAADVDINFTTQQLDNGAGNGAAPATRPSQAAASRPAGSRPTAPQSTPPATQPAQSNAASNAVQ